MNAERGTLNAPDHPELNPPCRSSFIVHRSAFTMIELLIAIGVVVILVAILTFGIRSISTSGRINDTKVTLENLRGMLNSLDATQKLGPSNAPAQWWINQTTVQNLSDTSLDARVDFWHMPQILISGNNANPVPIAAPASVKTGSADREGHWTIRNTAIAMLKIQAIPSNREVLTKLPPQRVLKIADSTSSNLVNENAAPILLDAWGNPIIFVPASGLNGVQFASIGTRMVTSTKLRNPANNEYATPMDRPFWASAGPDGDFSAGEDNLYSFEN